MDEFIQLDATAAPHAAKEAAPAVAADVDAPWRSAARDTDISSALLRLHNEILEFSAYIEPDAAEWEGRQRFIAQLRSIVGGLWPEASLEVFGSMHTGLCMAGSDIDCVVLTEDVPRRGRSDKMLRKLAASIEGAGMATDMEVITTARVPIIKFKHAASGVAVDISFDVPGGLRTAEMVKDYMRRFPMIKPLALVLKYFLAQRDLNETYTGGVGSFMLTMMLVSMMQHRARDPGPRHRAKPTSVPPWRASSSAGKHTRFSFLEGGEAGGGGGGGGGDGGGGDAGSAGDDVQGGDAASDAGGAGSSSSNNNNSNGAHALASDWHTVSLGELLLEFFYTYGCTFNYVHAGISVRHGGTYYRKAEKGWVVPGRPALLSLENPDEPELDVGKNSFAVLRVRKAFAHAYNVLVQAMIEEERQQAAATRRGRAAAAMARGTEDGDDSLEEGELAPPLATGGSGGQRSLLQLVCPVTPDLWKRHLARTPASTAGAPRPASAASRPAGTRAGAAVRSTGAESSRKQQRRAKRKPAQASDAAADTDAATVDASPEVAEGAAASSQPLTPVDGDTARPTKKPRLGKRQRQRQRLLREQALAAEVAQPPAPESSAAAEAPADQSALLAAGEAGSTGEAGRPRKRARGQ